MKRFLPVCLFAACLTVAGVDARAQDFFSDLFGGGAAPPRGPSAPAQSRVDAPKQKKAKKNAKPAAPPAVAATPQAPQAEGPPPPYEPQLLRLSEILGALSFLRDLCGDADGEDWRAKMTSLLDAEARSGQRRAKLTGAFNRGFHGYETTYRSCTANARSAITRYLDEGGRIAHDIAYRYGAS